jgi:hypothetical protein
VDKSSATRIITVSASVTDSFGKIIINGTLKVLVRE